MQSWLVDGNRIATKIKNASNHESVKWETNPSKACPNCHHVIDNSDITHQWPGLPRGVKFDPTDQEIAWHLLAKAGKGDAEPHPFIEEFIPTVDNEDGICYTHPQNLPGVKQDGSPSHFFHRAVKAFNTGTRKRRKIQGDVRWHKTGRTKPVILDGVHVGNKKFMVLYISLRRGKAEKTNWVMHQYHLGTDEDEREGEYVISKIFLQQQQLSKTDEGLTEGFSVTSKSVTSEPPCSERHYEALDSRKETAIDSNAYLDPELPQFDCMDEQLSAEGISQIFNTQQLAEGLSMVEGFLLSQSSSKDEAGRPCLSDYGKLGPESLKKDLEECQNLHLDPADVVSDTPPEFRLSQLEFGSQDSFLAWGERR